jgi:long-subunit acyl-CoA synthetase (AMP-forming)
MGVDRCTTSLIVGTTDQSVVRELAALGIEVRRGWACAPAGGLVTAARRSALNDPSLGPPMPGVSVRIVDGRIEVRRPGGRAWIPTGARGRLDTRGELRPET